MAETVFTWREADKKWERETGAKHTFRLQSFRGHVLEVEDVHFHHDSAVLLPDYQHSGASTGEEDHINGLAVLTACYRHAKRNPAQKILIAGHTDTSGGADYNLTLSQLRADNVLAALQGDRDLWVSISHQKHKVEDYQQILKWASVTRGWNCDPGPVNNVHGPQTGAAVKSFQKSYNQEFHATIAEDGAVGPQTWGAFFDVYMDELKKSLKPEDGELVRLRQQLKFLNDAQPGVGCGENHPLDAARKDNYRSQINRRVEILFFDPGEEPKMDCHPKRGSCVPLKCEVYNSKLYQFIHIPVNPVPPSKAVVSNLRWEPEKGSCGDKVKLLGDTTLPDGTEIKVNLRPARGASPDLPAFLPTIASGGKITHEWEIQNVAFKDGPNFLDFVNVEATPEVAPGVTAILKVEALLDAAEETFKEDRTWSGFSNHSEFKQKIEKFKNIVNASFNVIKAWGGYYVNLTSAGVTGTAGGCPWAGHRWARSVGANPMAPDQYFDGTNWVPLPAGFVLTGTNHSALGFYKSGGNFVSTQGGTWPGSFADYDFNSATYTKRRADWIADTHRQWTDVFHIRRKDCHSVAATRCCRYEVDVTLSFNVVTTFAGGVIPLCPGTLRSNAGVWFMDETRISVAAHETGHHMDNPDEYAGGAVDPTLNGDGAVAGIDNDSIMGQNLTVTKKRHYRSFVEMNKRLIKSAYKRDYNYEVVDK